MSTIKRFEDIEAWQLGRVLCDEVYTIKQNSDLGKDFKLWNQINSSSGSVMDNIAEGFERGGRKEFRQFLSGAKASAGETKSQLYRALDREYISQEKFEELEILIEKIKGKIGGLMRYLQQTEYAGVKFKKTKNTEQ